MAQTVGRVDGVKSAHVMGMTAETKDYVDFLKGRAPLVVGFVLVLAFLLLLVTFRSIVIPIKAIVLNLLSVAAAYGVLTWVFQDGHLEGLLGFESNGGVTAWLPIFLFVILFGLSMDYHVFILSRVKEAVDRGMKTDDAVTHAIKATASTVTSAAIVMVAVFGIFATLSFIDFKQMGVGLAVAILLDATIVRAVLLPATMKLLGKWNWYLPKKLHWLPEFRHEPLPEPGASARARHPTATSAVPARSAVDGALPLRTASTATAATGIRPDEQAGAVGAEALDGAEPHHERERGGDDREVGDRGGLAALSASGCRAREQRELDHGEPRRPRRRRASGRAGGSAARRAA